MGMQSIALIIVDMQQGMSTPAAGERNNIDAESNIQHLLKAWGNAGLPIIHVRHNSRNPDSLFWPGQPGVEFQTELVPLQGEHIVEKYAGVPRSADEVHAMSLANLDGEYAQVMTTANVLNLL